MDNKSTIYTSIIPTLKKIVGDKNLLSEHIDLSVYGCDAETLDVALPDLVVLPGSTNEVQAIMKIAYEHKLPVTARGAGTGLSGGATSVCGGISLVLTRMTKIIEIDFENEIAVVEVGVTNSAVSEAVKKFDLCFAPDPSSQYASTIGGNIAENAGGPHTLKYGTTTDHILGIKMVLADSSVIEYGGKHIARLGLDWLSLIAGSEGTLGIVTEAILKLSHLPEVTETMSVYFETMEAAAEVVSRVVAAGITPCAMEMLDRLTLTSVEEAFGFGLNTEAEALLIIEIDGTELSVANEKKKIESILTGCNIINFSWAQNKEERASMWKARKAAFAALGRLAPFGYVLDGVVPRSKLALAVKAVQEIGDKYSLAIASVCHAGDGNMHPCLLHKEAFGEERMRVLKASYEILKSCVELGGALSGEHGIGIEKVQAMPFLFSPVDLTIMEWVKKAFDPDLLCNPGKMLPNPSLCGESGMRPLLRHNLAISC